MDDDVVIGKAEVVQYFNDCFIRIFCSIAFRFAMVAVLNSSLNSLVFSRYYGGADNDYAYSVATDADNSIYICGLSFSTNLFLIEADQFVNNGNGDGFVVRFRPNSDWIEYSSYFGGNGTDYLRSVSCDNQGEAYFAGFTESTDLPISTPSVGDGTVLPREGLILGLDVCHTDFSLASVDSPTCEDSEVNLTSDFDDINFTGQDFAWTGPNGFTSSDQNPVFTASTQSAGTYTVTVTDLGCTSTSEVTLAVDPALGTSIIGPASVLPLTPTSYVVSENLGSTVTWSVNNGGTLISGQGTNNASFTFPNVGVATITATETNGNCSETVTFNVNVGCVTTPAPPTVSGPSTVEPNTSATYSVPTQAGYSYTWTVTGGAIVSGAGTNTINVQWGVPGAGTVSIIWAAGNGCASTPAVTNVTIETVIVPQPQWILVNGDATGDGANPVLMDGTQLEYLYNETTDSLFFRVTTSGISTAQSQDVGVNVMVNIPNGGNTFNFWGNDNMDPWHKLVTTWVTGSAPSAYSGTNGIADVVGVGANNFTNLYQNNISIVVNPTASTIVIGMNRSDLISNAQMGSGIAVAAAVGASTSWNDDIYLPGATITVSPQGIFDGLEAEQLSIYPNPSNGLFGLDLTSTDFTTNAVVEVLDNTGRVVYQSAVNGLKMNIDLADVATGIYMLQVREENLLGSARVSVVK